MSLRTQTLINSLGSLILMGCQWLISMALVRLSGYEDAGVFALAMSIANIFATLVNYGMRSYQAADTDYVFLPEHYVFARFGLSCIAVLVCSLYLITDSYSARNAVAIMLYLGYSLCLQISDIMMGNLQRANHLELNGYSNSLRGLLCLILFIATEFLTGELLYALTAMGLGSLMILVCFDVPLHQRQFKGNRQNVRELIAAGFEIYQRCFYVMISSIIPIVITAIPRREILRELGERMLGFFSSVYTPMVILSTLIPALILGRVPVIALLWKDRQTQKLRKKILESYGIVALMTLAALLFSVLAGKTFLCLIYSTEILPYTTLLYYAVVAIGLNCACVCGNYILVAFERRKQVALYALISLLIAIVSVRPMIGILKLYGAACVLIIAYGIQVFLQLLAIARCCRNNGDNET